MSFHGGMVGWDGTHATGSRPQGIHPLASIGGPPESRTWMVGDPATAPDIAKTALIHAFCTVDAGLPGSPTTRIGERTFLQARVHVGHNAVIGDDVELCAGVVICGHAHIGDGARVSGNAWVKPRVHIGEGAIIGGGAVVTKDVPAHEVWAGNPARYMKDADTHPGNQSELSWVSLTYPTVTEIIEYIGYGAMELERERAQSGIYGLGYGVDGDFA